MAKDNPSMAGAFPASTTRGGSAPKTAAPPPKPTPPDSTLGRVAGRAGNALKRLDTSKLAMRQTGAALIHTGETMSTLFLGSMAEGFFGPEKLKLGGMDLRAPTGLATQAYGLYTIMTGEKGGEHALALGNGVTGSWLASVGRDAGQALKERKAGPTASPAPAGATAFRGESPIITIPYEPEIVEDYPAPVQQGAYPSPFQGHPQSAYGGPYPQLPPGPPVHVSPYQAPHAGSFPHAYPAPMQYLPAPSPAQPWQPPYTGAPSMQGHFAPVEPVQLGAATPHYPQSPAQPTSAWQPGAPGLLPEPTPRLAGTPRELMLTPETPAARPQRPAPAMMLTPQAEAQAPFEGRVLMLTPEAQAKANATVEATRQRRDAAAHAYQAQQAAAQTQTAQTQTTPQTEPYVAGNDEAFSGFRERFERRHERRQARREDLRTLRQNRFPSAHALDEVPEGE